MEQRSIFPYGNNRLYETESPEDEQIPWDDQIRLVEKCRWTSRMKFL